MAVGVLRMETVSDYFRIGSGNVGFGSSDIVGSVHQVLFKTLDGPDLD